ncbi:MAG: hypothetical protein JRJ29_10050 [Deltaproteobacteria bacterium]|nr:hypothetical protein [Deltaproteobacteria bacterium]
MMERFGPVASLGAQMAIEASWPCFRAGATVDTDAFAQEMAQAIGKGMRPVDIPEECAEGVDIILPATSSLHPDVQPEWLAPGVRVSCMKSQEIDRSVLERCHWVAIHTKLHHKRFGHILPGTLYIPQEHAEGWWKDDDLGPEGFTDLTEVISGRASGRAKEVEVTCFANNIGPGASIRGPLEADSGKGQGSVPMIHLPSEWFTQDVHP